MRRKVDYREQGESKAYDRIAVKEQEQLTLPLGTGKQCIY